MTARSSRPDSASPRAPRRAPVPSPKTDPGAVDPAVFLAGLNRSWARLVAAVGPYDLTVRTDREPFEALVRAVAHQQLHGTAAEAITNRLLALYPDRPFPTPDNILATDPDRIRACGFSASKLTAIRGIAQGALDGVVPTRAQARAMSDENLIAQLITLRGVGRWTVEMLLMFTLGRPDVLPVDDFGVREGYRRLTKLEAQPTPKELRAAGAAWSPHRTAASWYLWRVPKA